MISARDDVMVGLERASSPVEWRISEGLVAYATALALMDARAAAIADGVASELIWLLEHPPLYTAGTSAKRTEVIEARFPVHSAGRGGQLTYHGPGQRVVYVMLDLKRRGQDVRRFVATLEEWIIRALASFDVAGERRADRIGVWARTRSRPSASGSNAGSRCTEWRSISTAISRTMPPSCRVACPTRVTASPASPISAAR